MIERVERLKEVFNLIRSALLAAAAQNKCTALVCSCYATARHPKNTGEDNIRSDNNKKITKNLSGTEINYQPEGQDSRRNGCANSSSNQFQGPCMVTLPLKSNLKKTTVVQENQLRDRRKVSWPDAHGKDLAQVLVYQSSVLEEGELVGVRNSCICTIQ